MFTVHNSSLLLSLSETVVPLLSVYQFYTYVDNAVTKNIADLHHHLQSLFVSSAAGDFQLQPTSDNSRTTYLLSNSLREDWLDIAYFLKNSASSTQKLRI